MNIVILTIILPYPLDSGGAQAQYNMIDCLRHRHNITLIFPENGMNSIGAMEELKRLWPEVDIRPYRFVRQLMNVGFLFSKIKRAFKKMFFRSSERFMVEWMLTPYGYPVDNSFARFVESIVKEKKADVLQVEFYPYLNFVHKLPRAVRKVFIHHEIRYIRNRRLLADIKLLPSEVEYMEFLKCQEINDLNCFDEVITLTDVDRKELLASGVTVPITVSPASVNAQIMSYAGWNGKITFLGGYGHTPNQEGMDWFISKVLPLVDWKQYPNVRVQIVGGGWPMSYNNDNGPVKVECKGFVNELADVAFGSIMIVPILSGSGMRMKILEAAAMGLPMVTTTVGVEGLDFENEKSCLIADTPQEFAVALYRLMENESLRKRLTDNARAVYDNKYSTKATSETRDTVYDKC